MNNKNYTAECLKILLNKYPQMRLGQLLCSVFDYSTLFYVTDEVLLKQLSSTYKITFPNKEEMGEIEVEETNEDDTKEEVEIQKSSPNKGKIYVHRGDEVRSIKKEDLESYQFLGFTLGKKDRT